MRKEIMGLITKEKGSLINKRTWLLGILAVLVGRVWVEGVNPFAVALFVCVCAEKKGRGVVLAGTLIGMFSVMDGPTLARYLLLMMVLWFMDSVENRLRLKKLKIFPRALMAGGINLLMGVGQSYLAYQATQVWWLAVLESIAIVSLANVFQWGVGFLLYGDGGQPLPSQEFISITILVTLALFTIPGTWEGIFSVTETIVYFLMMYVGYRYGSSYGAIMGAAGGILAAVRQQNTMMIGLYCLLGIGIGMFRQAGRILTAAVVMTMGGVLVYVFRQEVIGVVELRGIISAILIFVAIPKKYMQVLEMEPAGQQEDPFAGEDIRRLANYKIEDFSGAFRKLSKAFSQSVIKENKLTVHEMEDILEELSRRVCMECSNCEGCWHTHYDETADSVRKILGVACDNGQIVLEDVEESFCQRCIHLHEYLAETNRQVKVAKNNLGWRNRMAESRGAVSEQMLEVSDMLKDFTAELVDEKDADRGEKKKMLMAFRRLGIQVKKMSVHRVYGGKLKVQVLGRCKGNHCVTKADIAGSLKEVTGISFAPAYETKNVLGAELEKMCFLEDTHFKYLTGVARVTKMGEEVSGDNYSFLELHNGELLMVLSDGMGSGNQACMESENLVDVLENLLEAGFQKESAIRLLNSLFVLSYGDSTFTTLDITSVDLYTGHCQIVKNGAAATFIRHKDKVEVIQSGALPVGVELELESTLCRRKLYPGDMVIMMTDGIIDAFPGDEPEFYVENILANCESNNPREVANRILMDALETGEGMATDDMTVLVAGIWEKN